MVRGMDERDAGKNNAAENGTGQQPVSDEVFEALETAVRNAPMGVSTFVAEMLLDKFSHNRDVQRWKEAGLPEVVSEERLAEIYAKDYPQHVAIAQDALAGIRTGQARSYGAIDQVTDAIAAAVLDRLPRKIDAYRYGQNGVSEELEVPGLGKLSIQMQQTGNGVFSYISSIEGPNFMIRNCRQTGRQYKNRWNDIARPNEIKIDPLDLEVHLYADNSGIFVKTRGLEYSNSYVNVFGIGNPAIDSFCDEMYPTRRGFKDVESEDIQAMLREKGYLAVDSFDGKERFKDWNFYEVSRDLDRYEEFVTELGRPFQLSWQELSSNSVQWLETEVLAKILDLPATKEQATRLPEAIPYPKQAVGTLYTWVGFRKAEKIEATEGDPTRVATDEKHAISAGYRLVPWGVKGDYPPVANDGFIWCGIGDPAADAEPDDFMIPGHHMDSDLIDYRNKLVKVNPKHAEDIYVVDYQVWDDYREAAFKKTDRLSDAQVDEMQITLAQTLIPIGDYKDNYSKPVVLIGRGLELDEVEIVSGVVYGEK